MGITEAQDNWSNQSVKFKIFPGFDTDELAWAARSRFRLDRKAAPYLRSPDPRVRPIIEALAERRAINIKEVLESFETWSRTRRRVRSPLMADLCCGHGLTGLIFAALEPKVERVFLLDRRKPAKAHLLLEAVAEAAPAVVDKVTWVEAPIEGAAQQLPAQTSIVAVHACGTRTDRAIDAAVAVESPALALMPCCYHQTAKQAPKALRTALGANIATDVARTYRLEEAGWAVAWAAIPRAITPMNRVLIGRR